MQTYIFRRPTFGGRFLCPFLLCSLAQPHTGGVLRRLLCGRQSFSAPCPCRATEFLLIIAHRRQKGKAIWRQNLFRPKTPPSAHKTHSLFSQKGGAGSYEKRRLSRLFRVIFTRFIRSLFSFTKPPLLPKVRPCTVWRAPSLRRTATARSAKNGRGFPAPIRDGRRVLH